VVGSGGIYNMLWGQLAASNYELWPGLANFYLSSYQWHYDIHHKHRKLFSYRSMICNSNKVHKM